MIGTFLALVIVFTFCKLFVKLVERIYDVLCWAIAVINRLIVLLAIVAFGCFWFGM